MRPISAALTILAALAIATPEVQATAPPEYFVDESKLPFEALPGATALWGVHEGAGFRVEVPVNWNGELVVWAHGFRGTAWSSPSTTTTSIRPLAPRRATT